jgi:hypothetical protein
MDDLNRFSVDLGETKVIWNFGIPIVVPINFSIEQEKYLKAALTTIQYGNVSVDNILKRYFENFEENKKLSLSKLNDNINFKYDSLINEILNFQKITFKQMTSELSKFDFEDDSESISFCGLIFKRLKSSFDASRVLIKQGFYFETYSLIRQMLEQIAFAYNIYGKNNYDEFISPTKCISSLKDFYPYSGKFYGLLSSKTHIDKTQIEKFFYVDENQEGQIILQSLQYSIETAIDLLIILDLYCCVFEYLFKNKISEYRYIINETTLNDKRETRIFYHQIFEKYNNINK